MSFWSNDSSKKSMDSQEYDRLVKRISDGDAKIRILETDIQMLRTDIANLRGKFNAKLKGIKEQELLEEKKVEIENNINDQFIPFG